VGDRPRAGLRLRFGNGDGWVGVSRFAGDGMGWCNLTECISNSFLSCILTWRDLAKCGYDSCLSRISTYWSNLAECRSSRYLLWILTS
jgi:hypothetical protein